MKVITRALQDKKNTGPHRSWWGFVYQGKRHLMRYGHLMLIIDSNREITFQRKKEHCTITDWNGIKDAIKQVKETDLDLKFNGNC